MISLKLVCAASHVTFTVYCSCSNCLTINMNTFVPKATQSNYRIYYKQHINMNVDNLLEKFNIYWSFEVCLKMFLESNHSNANSLLLRNYYFASCVNRNEVCFTDTLHLLIEEKLHALAILKLILFTSIACLWHIKTMILI